MCKRFRGNAETWDVRRVSFALSCWSVMLLWKRSAAVWMVCCMSIRISVKGGGRERGGDRYFPSGRATDTSVASLSRLDRRQLVKKAAGRRDLNNPSAG